MAKLITRFRHNCIIAVRMVEDRTSFIRHNDSVQAAGVWCPEGYTFVDCCVTRFDGKNKAEVVCLAEPITRLISWSLTFDEDTLNFGQVSTMTLNCSSYFFNYIGVTNIHPFLASNIQCLDGAPHIAIETRVSCVLATWETFYAWNAGSAHAASDLAFVPLVQPSILKLHKRARSGTIAKLSRLIIRNGILTVTTRQFLMRTPVCLTEKI